MSNKKIVLIATEGETDDLFYKKILNILKTKTNNCCFNVDKIDFICVKGFGKFESKLISKYKNLSKKYQKEYKNCDIYIFLCHDNDVFIGKRNPPISWKRIEKELYQNKATGVYHIVADKTIEDFILYDFDGVLKYLRLSNLNKNNYKGLDGLKKLFKKAQKAYIKGTKCEGLLNALNFNIIEVQICSQLSKLCDIIGVNCKNKL